MLIKFSATYQELQRKWVVTQVQLKKSTTSGPTFTNKDERKLFLGISWLERFINRPVLQTILLKNRSFQKKWKHRNKEQDGTMPTWPWGRQWFLKHDSKSSRLQGNTGEWGYFTIKDFGLSESWREWKSHPQHARKYSLCRKQRTQLQIIERILQSNREKAENLMEEWMSDVNSCSTTQTIQMG